MAEPTEPTRPRSVVIDTPAAPEAPQPPGGPPPALVALVGVAAVVVLCAGLVVVLFLWTSDAPPPQVITAEVAPAPPAPTNAEILRDAEGAVIAGDTVRARELLAQVVDADGADARRAKRRLAELAVVGSTPTVAATRWHQGRPPPADATTLVLFFEPWCPFSAKAAPVVQALWAGRRDRGLHAVGYTRQTRDATEADVRAFLAEAGAAFPAALVGDAVPEAFAVNGVPAVAVLAGGAVVWRGHPDALTGALLDRWLPVD